MALTPFGGMSSAGNNFNITAPNSSAANASVGVATPGHHDAPSSRARLPTLESILGATISWPPVSTTSVTSSADSTVPAPATTLSPNFCAIALIDFNGSGELSGTSINLNPASTRTSATGIARSGARPRNMAISGFSAIEASHKLTAKVPLLWQ